MNDKKNPESPYEFNCELCNYRTQHKRDFDKHLFTAKHKRMINNDETSYKCPEKFECDCGKLYKFRQGLFSHKKNCKGQSKNADNSDKILSTQFFMQLINENKEFKNLLIEQQKENKELMNKMVEIAQQQLTIPTTVINNPTMNNTTNNNQTFNLQLFLNETCKDAMNIQEFIENVKITFDELLLIGNSGFITGLSDIFIKQLRDLEINKRPIHCTDAKRETIYLKEQDSWNKDDKDKTRLKQIIEKIEYKNVAALHNWCNENPDAKVNNTPNNLLKDKIFYQTLQGDDKTRDKIIKNISKEVTIEKQNILLEN